MYIWTYLRVQLKGRLKPPVLELGADSRELYTHTCFNMYMAYVYGIYRYMVHTYRYTYIYHTIPYLPTYLHTYIYTHTTRLVLYRRACIAELVLQIDGLVLFSSHYNTPRVPAITRLQCLL